MSRLGAVLLLASLAAACRADGADPSGTPEAGTSAPPDANLGADAVPFDDAGSPVAGKRLMVAYYADWGAALPVSSIEWGPLTHVAEAFALPASSGGIANAGAFANDELVSAAHAHGVRVVVSVGGAQAHFDTNLAEGSVRGATVSALAALCKEHSYDGIDVDWEFPDATTVSTWVLLMQDLRVALDRIRPKLSLSTTIGPWSPNSDVLPVDLLASLSWVGAMTYRYASASSGTVGFYAPLGGSAGAVHGSVEDSVGRLVARGIPPEKLLLGLGFYGIEFDDGPPGTRLSSASKVTDLTQAQITPLLSAGWRLAWDEGASEPALTLGRRFVTYEDTQSIDAKCAFAHDAGLGGAMVWEIAQGVLPDGGQPLLEHAAGCR